MIEIFIGHSTRGGECGEFGTDGSTFFGGLDFIVLIILSIYTRFRENYNF